MQIADIGIMKAYRRLNFKMYVWYSGDIILKSEERL
jgi:hypothetical protein